MHIPDLQLHHANTLQEAASLMEQLGPRAEYLAGGTDLLVDLKTGRADTDHLISIAGIEQVNQITLEGGDLTIGSLVTVGQLNDADLSGAWSAVQDATRVMAAPAIRNMATVGGNLASAVPSADLPPIFMVLGASVNRWSPTQVRSVSVADFFTGVRRTVRACDEVLTCVCLPLPPMRSGAAYVRFALREGNAIAVAAAAAQVVLGADQRIESASVAIGAVAPTPLLLRDVPAMLAGRPPDESAWQHAADAAAAAADPISDIRGSAAFRRELIGVLTKRALRLATERIDGGSE